MTDEVTMVALLVDPETPRRLSTTRFAIGRGRTTAGMMGFGGLSAATTVTEDAVRSWSATLLGIGARVELGSNVLARLGGEAPASTWKLGGRGRDRH